jgi:hypothetical protein
VRPRRAANLGPQGQRRRLGLGVLLLAAGAGLVVGLNAVGAGPGWSLLAVVPFFGGMLGVLQAREGT